MGEEKDRVYCTIDHTNKLSDGVGFDPYKFWLNQSKRRKEIEAAAKDLGQTEDDVAACQEPG